MKTLKNAFNTVINFIAKWFDKAIVKVAALTTPLFMHCMGYPGAEPLSTKMVLNFVMGVAAYVVGLIGVAYLSVIFMTCLTLLLALVLPILAANLIACGLTIALITLIGIRSEKTREDNIKAAVSDVAQAAA